MQVEFQMSMQWRGVWSVECRQGEKRKGGFSLASHPGSPSLHRAEKSPANGKKRGGCVLEQELRLIKLDTVGLNAEIHYHSGPHLLSQYNL